MKYVLQAKKESWIVSEIFFFFNGENNSSFSCLLAALAKNISVTLSK